MDRWIAPGLLIVLASMLAVVEPAAAAASMELSGWLAADALNVLNMSAVLAGLPPAELLPEIGVVVLLAMGIGALKLMRRHAASCYGGY